MNTFQTSPFAFEAPSNNDAPFINALTAQRYSSLDVQVLKGLWFFLEPTTLEAAEESGISREVLGALLQEKLILPCAGEDMRAASTWEASNWSRAAYLTYSQLNLLYSERGASANTLQDLVAQRRFTIESYLEAAPYPERFFVPDAPRLLLPRLPEMEANDLDALFTRKSCRAFSDKAISADAFSRILWSSTYNVRLAEESKKGGDPYFLLNSFYTWLTVFVAVQGVSGIPRGLYQYDPLAHELLLIREAFDDTEVSDCIQEQRWIRGGGFCVFVAAQWERYFWVYRHSRAFLNLLIQVGEYGEELVIASYSAGLAGWMTPAVHESLASDLFALRKAPVDCVYFLKFGVPAETERHEQA